MDKLELTFQVEKDTKNTRRYQEDCTFNSGRCVS